MSFETLLPSVQTPALVPTVVVWLGHLNDQSHMSQPDADKNIRHGKAASGNVKLELFHSSNIVDRWEKSLSDKHAVPIGNDIPSPYRCRVYTSHSTSSRQSLTNAITKTIAEAAIKTKPEISQQVRFVFKHEFVDQDMQFLVIPTLINQTWPTDIHTSTLNMRKQDKM